MTAAFPSPFLRAEWRHVAVLNFEAAPRILEPFVPRGTELDFWNGRHYVSLVGFLFQKTKVLGLSIPFHRDFEEVNLRLYVRRRASDGWRRAVAFIKEIVPRAAIAFVARTLYNENYVSLPMGHRLHRADDDPSRIRAVAYRWRFGGRDHGLELSAPGVPSLPEEGSEESFIVEHYWGYSAQRDGGTVEYRVDHPPWRVAAASDARLHADVGRLYGPQFVEFLRETPTSAFLAEGSAVTVCRGTRLR